jgi:hypothetical protein
LKHRPLHEPSPAENLSPHLIRSLQHSIFTFQTILLNSETESSIVESIIPTSII